MFRKLVIFSFLFMPALTFGQTLPRYEVAISKVKFESAINIDLGRANWNFNHPDMKNTALYELEANDVTFDKENGLLYAVATNFCTTTLHDMVCMPSPKRPMDYEVDLSQVFKGWETVEIRERTGIDVGPLKVKRTFYKKVLDYGKGRYTWEEVFSVTQS